MNRFNFKAFNLKTIVTSGVAAVVLLSTVAFAALNGNTAQSALAQTSAATPVKTITVIGDGKVKIKPDIGDCEYWRGSVTPFRRRSQRSQQKS